MKMTSLKIGGLLVLAVVLLAIFAPVFSFNPPYQIHLSERFLSPSPSHWFGTDQNGSDILSEVLYGARISLSISLIVVSLTLIIGLIIGSAAGYYGGWVDTVLMRLVDVIFAFPGFILVLALLAVLQESSARSLILALTLTGWASYSRLVRAEILHLKEREHVLAAKALGLPTFKILLFHIWPNLLSPLIVQAAFNMAGVIMTESSLSFLGLGISPKTPTWGALLGAGRQYLIEAPYLSLFPGLFILCLVLGFNLIGDGLRDYLDPKKNF